MLRVLDLSSNMLTVSSLDPLISCPLLLKLDLSRNSLETLPGSKFWAQFQFLRILHLHENVVGGDGTGLNECVNGLANSNQLQVLTLYDNPIAQEPGYRHHIVNLIWSLRALDYHIVSDSEIIEGANFPGRFAPLSPQLRFALHQRCKQYLWDELSAIFFFLLDVKRRQDKHSPIKTIQRCLRAGLHELRRRREAESVSEGPRNVSTDPLSLVASANAPPVTFAVDRQKLLSDMQKTLYEYGPTPNILSKDWYGVLTKAEESDIAYGEFIDALATGKTVIIPEGETGAVVETGREQSGAAHNNGARARSGQDSQPFFWTIADGLWEPNSENSGRLPHRNRLFAGTGQPEPRLPNAPAVTAFVGPSLLHPEEVPTRSNMVEQKWVASESVRLTSDRISEQVANRRSAAIQEATLRSAIRKSEAKARLDDTMKCRQDAAAVVRFLKPILSADAEKRRRRQKQREAHRARTDFEQVQRAKEVGTARVEMHWVSKIKQAQQTREDHKKLLRMGASRSAADASALKEAQARRKARDIARRQELAAGREAMAAVRATENAHAEAESAFQAARRAKRGAEIRAAAQAERAKRQEERSKVESWLQEQRGRAADDRQHRKARMMNTATMLKHLHLEEQRVKVAKGHDSRLPIDAMIAKNYDRSKPSLHGLAPDHPAVRAVPLPMAASLYEAPALNSKITSSRVPQQGFDREPLSTKEQERRDAMQKELGMRWDELNATAAKMTQGLL